MFIPKKYGMFALFYYTFCSDHKLIRNNLTTYQGFKLICFRLKPAVSKNTTYFKRGQNCPQNNNLP